MNGNQIDIGTITEDRLSWDLRKKLDGINTVITTLSDNNSLNQYEKIKEYVLTDDLTLTSNSEKYLFLNPNGSHRSITLPDGIEGQIFIIKNMDAVDGTYYLEINNFLDGKKEIIKPQVSKGYIFYDGWIPLNDRFFDFGLTGNTGEQSNSSTSNKAPFVTATSVHSVAIGIDSYVDGDYSVAFPNTKCFNDYEFAEGGLNTHLYRTGEVGKNLSESNQNHYTARVGWSKITATAFGTYEMFLNGKTNERFTLNDNSETTGIFILNGISQNGGGEDYRTFRLLTLKRGSGASSVTIPNNTDLYTSTPDVAIQSSIVANTTTGDFEVWVTNGGVSYNRDMVWTAIYIFAESRA